MGGVVSERNTDRETMDLFATGNSVWDEWGRGGASAARHTENILTMKPWWICLPLTIQWGRLQRGILTVFSP